MVFTYTWVVAGLSTPAAVLADDNFPVEFNDPDPYDGASGRKCFRRQVNANGLYVFSVDASFQVPPATDWTQNEPSLSNPLVYQWDTVTENVAIDRDTSGNAIVTSALRSPSTPVQQTRNYKRLTITKWMAGYDLSRAMSYENTVNSDSFSGADAGEVKCDNIQPSTQYESTATLIPIAHVFSFKDTSIWGADPWQTLMKDQDGVGWDGTYWRPITSRAGERLADVPMNGHGQPLDTSLTYLDDDGVVEASPSWASNGTPTGATVIDAGAIKLLQYDTLPEVAFSGLSL